MQRLVSDSERLSLLKSEAGVCFAACQGAGLVVFNLFSLEGYFIALHLGVPCLAASPHILNRYIVLTLHGYAIASLYILNRILDSADTSMYTSFLG